jgi:glutamate-ammonia-ligase adenylyltransferase
MLAAVPVEIPFREQERARRNLEAVRRRAPEGVVRALMTVLQSSADPDGALNLFERMVEEVPEEYLRLLEQQPTLIHYAAVLFANTPWLAETLIQNPDLFQSLAKDRSMGRSLDCEAFRENLARFQARSFERDTSLLLARFKKREYVRIVLRDLLGVAHLAETTSEISALSDVMIEEALREADAAMRKRYGDPQALDKDGRWTDVPFAVLSLGKLGGNELNYSSDVDLLYLYGDGEAPESAAISNREYFVRLAQTLTEMLSRMTAEGPVFRIDLRLRPQGREGEPAVSLSQALHYYTYVAHDWELQAMIKARHSAGDRALARRFLRGVQPVVYTPELNFAAIETALNSLEKIGQKRSRDAWAGDGGIDVKLDHGGIRDIEFLVQCLQRVYGGSETWLRSGGTLFSLQKLHDKGHISGKEFHELTTAYTFLRRIEHRLQLRRGQQTHHIPSSEEELSLLCASLAERETQAMSPEQFLALTTHLMENVSAIYQRIIHEQQRGTTLPREEFVLSPTPGLMSHEVSYAKALERLASDSPELHAMATRPEMNSFARRNLMRFVSAAMTTEERYRYIVEAPQAVERAVRIFETSGYLSDVLMRYPEVITAIEQLHDPGHASTELFPAGEGAEKAALGIFSGVAESDLPFSERMDLLRQRFREQLFASAARDIIYPRPVYESLAQTTTLADGAIAAAMKLVQAPMGIAVLALGRLGTREFDWHSDADLLFVREEGLDATTAVRTAEQLMQVLAAYTRFGNIFAVDARLRPFGAEGALVSTPSALETYFKNDAQVWEALTYTKLRWISGSRELAERALAAVRRESVRFSRSPELVKSVREMRLRLERSEAGAENLKTSPGAFYDIDFLVSTLQLRAGTGSTGQTGEQIRALEQSGALSSGDAGLLAAAAELYRAADHAIRLVTGRSRKTLTENETVRRAISELCERILGREIKEGLSAELRESFIRVRDIYERVLAG